MFAQIYTEFDNFMPVPPASPIFMPHIDYGGLVVVIRIILIACAVFLWWKSVKLFRNNKLLMPGVMNFLAYVLIWFGGYEVVLEVYQCGESGCPYDHTILSHGFLGIKIFTVEDEERQCEHKTKYSFYRSIQIRYWGGLIPFLPNRRYMPLRLLTRDYMYYNHSKPINPNLDTFTWILSDNIPFPRWDRDGDVVWEKSPFPRGYKVEYRLVKDADK